MKGCLPLTRVFWFQFPFLSFFQFLTITDTKDVHYYLFYGEEVPQQKGISSDGTALASHERGTGRNTQILQSLEGMQFLFAQRRICGNRSDFVVLILQNF